MAISVLNRLHSLASSSSLKANTMPVLDQNIYYLGMRITSATFTATMTNVIPAITFLLAWVLRLEVVNWKEVRGLAKVFGTIVSVSGAMVMTLYKGPIIGKGSLRIDSNHESSAASTERHMVKGPIFLIIACCCWSAFVILQTITLRDYPLELSLAALICLMGAAEGTVLALVMERGRLEAWSIGWNMKLLAIVFSAVVCSGMGFCFQGSVMKEKGPVFATAFSPLSMILVAMAGLLFLGEDLFLGGLIGSLLVVFGLYMVIWGKGRDPPSQNQSMDVEITSDA